MHSRSTSSRTLRCVGMSSILLILTHRHQLGAYLSRVVSQQGAGSHPRLVCRIETDTYFPESCCWLCSVECLEHTFWETRTAGCSEVG